MHTYTHTCARKVKRTDKTTIIYIIPFREFQTQMSRKKNASGVKLAERRLDEWSGNLNNGAIPLASHSTPLNLTSG